MKGSRFLFGCMSLFLLWNETYGQNVNSQLPEQMNVITTAVPFLMIGPDARAGGMGDAGVASTPDANSSHWNPAKYAFCEKDMGMSISYTPWLKNLVSDINLSYLSGYKRLDKDQVISASLLYFSLGDITFTDNNGNSLGTFRPNEFSLDGTYSRKLSKHFSGAVSLRYIYSNLTGNGFRNNISTHPGMSVASDVSGYYHENLYLGRKKGEFAFGFNFSNIGTKISYTTSTERDFIPMNLRFGPSLKIDMDEYNSMEFIADINKLLVPTPPIYYQVGDVLSNGDTIHSGNAVIKKGMDPNRSVANAIFTSFYDAPDGFKEELQEYQISLGVEYWYLKRFALRAGYFYENPYKGNRQYYTFGMGLRYNVFNLDFSYLVATDPRTNPLSNTLRFTLVFDFEAFKNQSKKSEDY
jgi:hypothetical protein